MMLMIDLFADVPPVLDCTELLAIDYLKRKYRTAANLANEMLREARQWQNQHPDKDVMEVITPDWKAYIAYNL